jgi:hypothetical protein
MEHIIKGATLKFKGLAKLYMLLPKVRKWKKALEAELQSQVGTKVKEVLATIDNVKPGAVKVTPANMNKGVGDE